MRKGPVYPSRFLDKIDFRDRPVGIAGWTESDVEKHHADKSEKKERVHFDGWLNRNGLLWRSDRMDKRTNCRVGWPDYEIFYNGQVLLIEWKSSGQNLSQDQDNVRRDFVNLGFKYLVEYDYATATKDVTEFFKLPFTR